MDTQSRRSVSFQRHLHRPNHGRRDHIRHHTMRTEGEITAAQTKVAIADFRRHYAGAYIPVETTSVLIDRAMDLAENHGLRGYDAVQLATALQVQAECVALNVLSLIFVSADQNLNAAAAAESLTVDDPNQHP